MGQTTRRKGTGLVPLFGPSRWTGPKGNLVQFPWPNSPRRNATAGPSVTPWIAVPAGTNGGNGRWSPNGPTRKNSFRPTVPRRDPRPVVGWLNRAAGGLCAVEQLQPLRGPADLSPSEASGAASSPGFSRVPVFCEPAAEGDAAEDTGIGASGHGEPLRSGTSIVLHVFKFSLHDDHPAGLIRRAVHPARTRAFAFIITKRLHKK